MQSLLRQALVRLTPPPHRRGGEPDWAARFDRWARGWRGPALAALVVLVSSLPGLLAIPPLDRDEARFAQASAQMLETGDLVNIRFQAEPRDKKPVGIHWLQTLSVKLFSSVERREIWVYRLPSLLGAMLAAAATAWGAAVFLGPRGGLTAGALLAATFLLSSEAGIGKTDAVLCGAVALSMAGLARVYAAARGDWPDRPRAKAWFWIGQALGLIIKGPIAPMVAGLAIGALWIADRRADWLKRLGWVWGLVLVAAVVGPWAAAITVATDGRFWMGAIGDDLGPKLVSGQESHWGPPLLHLAVSPLLLFPVGLMLPAALVYGWRKRREPFARFALAWLVPAWLVFEAMPTKLVHYPLPLYPALAALLAGALMETLGAWSRRLCAALSVAAGGVLAAVCLWAAAEYGGMAAGVWAFVTAALLLAAGIAGGLLMIRHRPAAALACAGTLGVLGHMAMGGGLAPSLTDLWVSDRAAQALADAGLDPRGGVTPGPVAVAGYAEPSLVFALGTTTQMGSADTAVIAIGEGRPALVEGRQEQAFRGQLAATGHKAEKMGEVAGFDYSDGDPVTLGVWRSLSPPSGGAVISGPRVP